MADLAASMTVPRSTQASRSIHECDARAERIVLMCDGMCVPAIPVEQLPAARQLAGERGAPAQEPALGRNVSTGAAGYAPFAV